MKRAAIAIGLLGVAFAGTTYWALESGGVAVVKTIRPDGSSRSTHVWFVREDGGYWLEAGSPNNGWYLDVLAAPELSLAVDGRTLLYRAEPRRDPGGQPFIRSLIREKYGLRDNWVGLLVDTSQSVAVRLMPLAPAH